VKKKRFSVEQIVATLKQIELGMTVAAASRQLGVSEQAIYRWKKVYGGLQSDQVRELKLLQEENARLKKLVAELSLDKAILQDINSKNSPARGEASGGGLRSTPLCDESPAGLPSGVPASQRPVLPIAQGPEDGAAAADAGACASAHPLRLPAPARAAEARGLVTGQGPDVPPPTSPRRPPSFE
jgi:putative transposase